MLNKLAFSQNLLKRIAAKSDSAEKTIGSMAKKLPIGSLQAGAALAGGYHAIGQGNQYARDFHAGFYPGGGQQ